MWVATLPGFELRWHKRGVDGSGKCSVLRSTSLDALVHGVLYRLPRSSKSRLDQIEGLGVGYAEATIEVVGDAGSEEALTYVATASHVDDSLRPYDWYKRLVIAGAAAHRLPPNYLAKLHAVESRPDPNAARAARHLGDLDRSA
jgi:hypothetical protein